MKKIKNIILCLLTIGFSLNPLGIQANGKLTESNSDSEETSEEITIRLNSLSEYGNVITKDSVKLGKYSIDFYVEYENPELALKEFVKKNLDVLQILQNKFELDDISVNNFNLYYEKFFELLNDLNNPYRENHEVISKFKRFHDIFENTEENNRILNMIDKIIIESNSLKTLDIHQNDALVELSLSLPYYSNLYVEASEKLFDSKSSTTSTRALTGTALSNAKSYAYQYYSTPNRSSYAYFSGNDCANFASQILEASGRQQVNGSASTGWWHRITYPYETFYPEYNLGAAVHEHSRSWTLADGFAKYFGVYNQYTTITSLSNAVKVGDFIVEDDYGDGEYDHVGFVTAVDTSALNYTDEQGTVRNYKNFEVTQHSSNYRAWVSSSANGWEYFNRGERVAIVRV